MSVVALSAGDIDMTNPWDRPTLPTSADLSIDDVYSGVGHVTSQWEGIEVQLCRMYSFFVLKPDDRMVMHDYGDQKIFMMRFEVLKQKAESFFCTKPSQEIEAKFDDLAKALDGYSARRNEVAHGIAMPAQIYKFFTDAAGTLAPHTNYYGLFPPHYKWRGQALDAVPPYAYNPDGLHKLATDLNALYGRLTEFREALRGFLNG